MTEEQAAKTSWHEYQIRLKGREKELEREWEIRRWQAFHIIRYYPMTKAAARPKKPKDLCQFPWETENPEELKRKAEQYRISPEEEAELNKIIKILDKA